MIIIRKDTVWGPGVKSLTDDVQIAPGVTLTVEPGTQIEGHGHSITAYGNFKAKGSLESPIFLNNVKTNMNDNYNDVGRIEIEFSHINGGEINGFGYGSIKLSNSVITDLKDRIDAWYPRGSDTVIRNNLFLDSRGIEAGTLDVDDYMSISISNNVFDRYQTYSGKHEPGYEGSALSVFNGGINNLPTSTGNAYLDTALIAIDLSGSGLAKSFGDYFGTSISKEVNNYVYDRNDDLSVKNNVHVTSPSLAVPKGVNDHAFSFLSMLLPRDVIIEARLFGTLNADLTGNKLNNVLIGNVGNNTIDGGLGADTMSGGAGNDTYIVDNIGDGIVESSNRGYDSVVASVSFALSANVEALTLTGAKAINATGNALANHLIGNGAANVLDGKAGADVMAGGAGNDTYLVDHTADRVIEVVGEGTDTVISTVSFALSVGQAVETLQFAKTVGTAALNLTGNELANTLVGSGGDNVLNGGGGVDALYGGSGNDTYVVDNLNDKVSEAKGAGTDAVLSSVSYALKGGQEIESLQLLASTGSAALNLTGNEFGQSLRGNAGANVLNGALGHDLLTGGKGADTFVFSTALGSTNVDRITDFAADDTIRLSKSIFSAIAPGQLADGAFKSVVAISTAKLDADDRILYKQATGELFYDADGSGTAAAVKFAVLDNKAALAAADFLIA